MKTFIYITTTLAVSSTLVTYTLAASDLTALYLQYYENGVSISALDPIDELPSEIQRLVDEVKVSWDKFPGLLQRAALWEYGYVLATNNKLVKIYTGCGANMADIDIGREQTELGSSEIQQCGTRWRAKASAQADMGLLDNVKCAAKETDEDAIVKGSFWAQGDPTDLSDVHLGVHIGDDWEVYAIHTSPISNTKSGCSAETTAIYPCAKYDNEDNWCAPEVNTTSIQLIKDFAVQAQKTSAPSNSDTPSSSTNNQSNQKSNSNLYLWIGIGAGAVILLIGSILLWLRCRCKAKNQAQEYDYPRTSYHYQSTQSLPQQQQKDKNMGSIHTGATLPISHSDRTGQNTCGMVTTSERGRESVPLSLDDVCRTSVSLEHFFTNSQINLRRLDYDHLYFEQLIFHGANAEIWCGKNEVKQVAIKRLLPEKAGDIFALEMFAEEVQLMAKLEHPNLVTFIGVAWHFDLNSLCVVTEFIERGDLRTLLMSCSNQALNWRDHKIGLACDIAEALVYLHSLIPNVIHRDLRCKNILVTTNMQAKLTGFGLSREKNAFEEMMTNGVGNLLWTAPEILSGNEYDERSDIYSFGAILTELDTHNLPFEGTVNEQGNPIKEVEIPMLVHEKGFRPAFSYACPDRIQELGDWCMQTDPALRPSAMQLVYHIRSKVILQLQH